MTNCELCGEPMPVGEEMFKYHGYSGPCPIPPKPPIAVPLSARWQELFWALPPGEMRSKLRALEIDISRMLHAVEPTQAAGAVDPHAADTGKANESTD